MAIKPFHRLLSASRRPPRKRGYQLGNTPGTGCALSGGAAAAFVRDGFSTSSGRWPPGRPGARRMIIRLGDEGKQQVMGEFIFCIAVAAVGFVVGRLSARRPAGTRDTGPGPSYGYGSTLPHPAQIFEEGYQAGLRAGPAEPLPTDRSSSGTGAGYTLTQGPAGPAPRPRPLPPPQTAPPTQQTPQTPTPTPMPTPTVPSRAPAGPVPGPAAARVAGQSAAAHPASAARPDGPADPGENRIPPAAPLPPRAKTPVPPPAKTQAELAEEKRRRDLRNINITLYSGSLLLVAAAALFIGISIPGQARFLGVVALTALFYAGGLVIHARRKDLRPAAVAFTGTGLALIPVVGLALYNFLLPDAALAWLVTSLVGTAAFAYAAARLESRVVTYLALTFLLSTALASGASLRSGIVWYFVFTVVLATLLSLAAIRRPGWLKNVYLDAFVNSHRFLVPATAAAAVLTSAELGSGALAVLFLAFAAYYAVLLWQGPPRLDLLHGYGVRAGATIGLVALADAAFHSLHLTLLAAVILLGVQAAGLFAGSRQYMAAAQRLLTRDRASADTAPAPTGPKQAGPVSLDKQPAAKAAQIQSADVLVLLGLQFLAGAAAAVSYALDLQAGAGNLPAFVVSAVLVQLTLFAAAWKLGGAAEPLAAAALLLPVLSRLLTSRAPLWPVLLLLGILSGYLVLRAVRAAGDTRPAFVLAARTAVFLFIPLAVFVLLETRAPETALTWTLAAAFAAASANQLASVLLGTLRMPERFPGTVRALSAAAAVLLAVGLRMEEAPATALTLSALWTIVVLNVLSAVPLRRHREAPSTAAAPAAVVPAVFGAAGFGAAALLGAGILGVRGYELLTAAALAYCAVQALKLAPRRLRGYYLGAAQVLVSTLAALIAADLNLTAHGTFVVVAVSLALQHLARNLLGHRLDPFGLGSVLTWGTLLATAAVAPAYYLLLGSDARAGTGCALLLIAGACAVYTQVASTLQLRKNPAAGPSATAAAAALVLLLAAGVRAVEAPAGTLVLLALWVAFSVNLFTAGLHRAGRLAFLAPGGFLAAAVLGSGVLGLRGYELLFAAALGYCVVLVLDRAGTFRGTYLAAAQVLGTVLAALIAADLAGGSLDVFFIALSAGFAVSQVLRTVFHTRLLPFGPAEHVRWGGLAVLALLPLAYVQAQGRAETATLLAMVLCAAAAFIFCQLDAAVRAANGRPLPQTTALLITTAAGTLLAVPVLRYIDFPDTAWALALLWTALAANTAASLLLRPGRWEALAVAGFAGAALTGAGVLGLRGFELLVLCALAYASYFASRRNQPNRGEYLLAAQLLVSLFAVLAAWDAGANSHGLFAVGCAVLAAAQLLRTFLEPRLSGIGLGAAALWTTLGLLALAPVGYLLGNWVQRDALTLQLLLLLAVSVGGFLRHRRAVILYPAVYALGVLPLVLTDLIRFREAGLLPEAPLNGLAAGLVLAGLAGAALAGEARAQLVLPVRTVLLTAAYAYAAPVLLIAAAKDSLLLAALAAAMLCAVFLTVSYSRGKPWFAAGTPPLLYAAAVLLTSDFERSILAVPLQPGFGSLWPGWTAALALQAIRFFMTLPPPAAGTQLRVRIMGAASTFALVLGAVPAMAEYNSSAVAGSLTLIAAVALAVREFPVHLRESAAGAACLVGALAVQRIAWFVLGEADPFWSVQYWAVVLAVLAGWEYLRKRAARGTVLLSAAAVILSGSGLASIGSGGAGQQLWALVAHAGLLAFGLLASRKLFTIWGAAGVALAVLWYLRGYTFLLLALLAAGLIALAVWRLTRVRSEPADVREKEESNL